MIVTKIVRVMLVADHASLSAMKRTWPGLNPLARWVASDDRAGWVAVETTQCSGSLFASEMSLL